jgi:hypothetical protein
MMILPCAAVYIADTLLHMQCCALCYITCVEHRQALPAPGASVFFGATAMPNEGDSSSGAAAAVTNNSSSGSGSGDSIVADQQQADATGADATTVSQVNLSMFML